MKICTVVLLMLMLLLPTLAITGLAADSPPAPESSGGVYLQLVGAWVGSRLQCRKDESGPVRCGTPMASKFVFRADGTGICESEGMPPEFTYQVTAGNKFILTTPDKAGKWEFFDIKIENEYIQFQTYIYPDAAKDKGEDYIHYIFDMSRETE
jgi:hypothetical protein